MLVKNRLSDSAAIPEESAESGQAKPAGWQFLACLSHRWSALAISCFFTGALAAWLALDQTIPGFDPAWHALFSSTVRRFMTHLRGWSLDNFINLFTMHFNYPASGWIFNGTVKVIAGDSVWGDRACLLVQACVLAFAFHKAAMLTWSDRIKANAGLIVLFCIPLVNGISHLPLLDFIQTAAFASFLAGMAFWRQEKSWKATAIAAVLFGFYCSTKQIAVLYCAPIIGLLLIKDLVQKQWKAACQTSVIAAAGPLFLLTWIIPNFSALLAYCTGRNQIGATTLDKLAMMISNLQISSTELWQGLSPLLLLVFAYLLTDRNSITQLKKSFSVVFPGLFGWIALITFAYYNMPEPRYFGPLAVSFALLFGGLLGEALRSSSKSHRFVSMALLVVAPAQMLLLNFVPAPPIKRPVPLGVNPIYDISGISNEMFLRSHIACDYRKDAWCQKWVHNTIENIEKGRYVYLCVLPSTWEFNQGSMAYISHLRKSHVIPVSWRGCNPDMTDRFNPPSNPAYIDWFVLKTGYQGTKIQPASGTVHYNNTINWIENSGDYVLVDSKQLPDNSVVKLYRKDYVKQWKKDATALRQK